MNTNQNVDTIKIQVLKKQFTYYGFNVDFNWRIRHSKWQVLLHTHLQGVISLQRNKRQECIFKTSFYGQSLKNLI